MVKRLFIVQVTDQLPVYAEDEAAAKKVARDVVTSFDYERWDLANSAQVLDWSRRWTDYLGDTLPWGDIKAEDGHELTIGEIEAVKTT